MLEAQRHCLQLSFAVTVLFTSTLNALEEMPKQRIDVTESAYLQAVRGFVGDELGATITDVTVDEDEDMQLIEIDIPIDPERVDRVQLIGPAGKRIAEDRTTEILRDYENNNVGLKIYVPKKKNWVFKLRLIDEQNDDAK